VRKSLAWAAVAALGILLPRVAALSPGTVEAFYSEDAFRAIARVLGFFSGLFVIDLAQIAIAAALAAVVLWLIISLARSVRLRSLRFGVHRFLAVIAMAVWSFYLLWGLNYARPPLEQRLGLARVAPDAPRLAHLARLLGREVNGNYSPASLRSGPPGRRPPLPEIARRIALAYDRIQPRLADPDCSLPKTPAAASWVMTRTGISGFYFPWTGEATVNGAMPAAAIPFAMAHEMAHQRGTAREDEANFLAYLACRESGVPAARYSGALAALAITLGALYQTAPDSVLAVHSMLEAGPRADRAAIRQFWRRHEGRASAVAEKVNDRYLKANAQSAGIASYDRAIELLVDYAESGRLERP
jgi:hypothetical protein